MDGLKIQWRMAKASASFCPLRQRLLNNHHVPMRVKGKIFRAMVLSTLPYGAEAWTEKRLHAFVVRHLRSIMRITWMDKNIKTAPKDQYLPIGT